jgi:hypothetical protein
MQRIVPFRDIGRLSNGLEVHADEARTDMSDDQPNKVLVDAEVVQRNDRYNELVNHLKSLNDDLKKGRRESEVCLDAVVAVKRFFDADEAVLTSGATRPLEIVAVSFRELSLGGNPRLFQQKRGVSNRPAGLTAPIQAVAAACLEVLHRVGHDFDRAATLIVRDLAKIGVTHTGRRREITIRTVQGWRAEMGGRNPPEALAMYRQMLDFFEQTFGADAPSSVVEQEVTRCIDGLRDNGFDGRQSKSD